MAGQTVYLLIFLIIIPRLELWNLACYSTLGYCDKKFKFSALHLMTAL